MFNILLIENDTNLRKRIKEILESKLPIVFVSGASGEKDTLVELEKMIPDLIIMDIRITGDGERGLKLLERVKSRHPGISIVVNTDYDSTEYQAAAVQMGADYFLSKRKNSINELVTLTQSYITERIETHA
jgi:DNA-binding NarL/FixJ family response regulator